MADSLPKSIKETKMKKSTNTLSGKIALVTGANAGIGKATCMGLAKMGATVIMVCRNRERAQAALTDIQRESGNENLHLLLADLSSQAQIRQLAADFKAQFDKLHILINNVGVILRQRTLTVDGIEAQFAINHLASFLLTNLLLDTIVASAPARIVNVAAELHKFVSLDFDEMLSTDSTQSESSYVPNRVYSKTKLANITFTYELARRLQNVNVTVNCLHPGIVATNLAQTFVPKAFSFMPRIIGLTPERGARTTLYLATSPEVANMTGKYFVNKKAKPSSEESYNQTTAKKLWDISEALTQPKP
jgi:NAD(P)-dependent dehydrogenase (short-subunit alcohol dehydrogenase family)